MKIVNACCQCLTETLVRAAVIGTGKQPTIAAMPEEQLEMTRYLFQIVGVESFSKELKFEELEAVKRLAEKYQPETLMGMKIMIDEKLPRHVIEFREPDGGVVGRIENLAIPIYATNL